MKRIPAILTALCVFLSGCISLELSNSFSKPDWRSMMAHHDLRIGILEFRGDNDRARIIADELAINLLNRGYKVTERGDMRLVLEQAGFSQFGDTDAMLAILKNTNKVDVLVTGNLSSGTMTMKVLRVSDGETLLANSYNVHLRAGGILKTEDFVNALAEPWP